MNILKKQGFTLVELIVVISILAILSTIGFLSFQGYSASARDSNRLADINSLEKALELYKIDEGRFPEPDDGVDVVYNGDTVWTQGVIGEEVTKGFKSITEVFLDPLTNTPYSYSITNDKKEYQIGAILEGGEVAFNTIDTANAADKKYKAYVVGNYNGKFTKIKKSSVIYIFNTPTILVSDLSDPNIINLFSKNLFVFNGFGNIPYGYNGNNILMDGSFTFGGTNPLLYSGDINNLSDLDTLKTFTEKYKAIIENSDLKDIEPYKSIGDLDLNDKEALVKLMIGITNDTLNTKIDIDEYVYPPYNHPPVAPTIGTQTQLQDRALSNMILPPFTDEEGDSLTYSISGLPAGLSFDSSTREISGTPTDDGSNDVDYTVSYSANDGTNPDVTTTFTFTIESPRVNNGAAPEEYLECMVKNAQAFKCRWPDVDDPEYNVDLNDTGCDEITDEFYTVTPSEGSCGSEFEIGDNKVFLHYNGWGDSTPSLTLTIPKPVLKESMFQTNAVGFSFDISNIDILPGGNYRIAFADEQYDNTEPINESTLIGEFLTTSNFDQDYQIEDALDDGGNLKVALTYGGDDYEDLVSDFITIVIPKPVLDSTMFNLDDSGLHIDLSNIEVHPNSDFTVMIDDTQCETKFDLNTITGTIPLDDDGCDRKLDDEGSHDIYILYNMNVNTSEFKTDAVTVDF